MPEKQVAPEKEDLDRAVAGMRALAAHLRVTLPVMREAPAALDLAATALEADVARFAASQNRKGAGVWPHLAPGLQADSLQSFPTPVAKPVDETEPKATPEAEVAKDPGVITGDAPTTAEPAAAPIAETTTTEVVDAPGHIVEDADSKVN